MAAITTPSAATQINYVAFNSSNHWFIADRNQGSYRSADQGATWTQISIGLTTKLGWTISVNPGNGDLISSTFSGGPLNANPVTFYRSTDEGNAWTMIPSGHLSAATAQTGCVFASNANIVCGGCWAPYLRIAAPGCRPMAGRRRLPPRPLRSWVAAHLDSAITEQPAISG